MKFLLKCFIIVIIIFSQKIQSQTMKWAFIAIKSTEYKEYVISKIKINLNLKYIAYCNTHQGFFIKYNTSIYATPHSLIAELRNSDEKLKEILLEKTNMDNEDAVLNLIHHCDFDETNGTLIKQELQN